MKTIKLMELSIKNFKGIRDKDLNFYENTSVIFGRNASGKTTLMDAFFWLLFGKDSQGRADFQIRPVDENGQMVDNVDIEVSAVLDVAGERVELYKKQSQKWTKHRGSSAPTFEGNVNSFQVDGFPVSQKEYAEKVSSIVSEELFKLITSPIAFPSMKWQDQRRILMRIVEDVSDEDLLNSDPEMYGPIRADVLAAGTDKAKEKATLALRKLKEEQKAFPIRIDEASRSIVEVDVASLTEKKEMLQHELETVMAEKEGLIDNSASIRKIQAEIMQEKLNADSLKFTRASKLREMKNEVYQKLNAHQVEVDGINRGIVNAERDRDKLCNQISDDEQHIDTLTAKYKAVKARAIPENATVCPTCGRPFDETEAEKIRNDFAERKVHELSVITDEGTALRNRINSNKAKVNTMTDSISTLTATLRKSEEELEVIKSAYNAMTTEPEMEHDAEYMALMDKIADLEKQVVSLQSSDDGTDAFVERIRNLKLEISGVDAELSTAEANERARSRITELQEAQRNNSQMVADQEQIVYLLEEFIKLKMNTISGHINAKFKNNVRFKLFEQLINGGMKETCVMQVNSNGSYVDYSNANHAAQILGGLDVIDALSELYMVSAPIWCDNAEALDTNNQPKSNSQLILLKVSDDKELTIKEG